MEIMSRSLRIEERTSSSSSSWKRLERSNSLLLASELAADSELLAQVTPYQRLSHSMRFTHAAEYEGSCKPITRRRRRMIQAHAAWTYLGKLFSFKRMKGNREQAVEADAATKPPHMPPQVQNKYKSSSLSWLPDPHQRWPIQGW